VPELGGQADSGLDAAEEPPLRVVLLGLPPVYRHGLSAGLAAAGIECLHLAVPDGLVDVPGSRARVVVLSAERAPAVLPPLAEAGSRAAAVLVVDEADTYSYADALRAGATGVVGVGDELPQVVEVVRAAAGGRTSMPREIARTLCRARSGSPPRLSAAEREWLLRLADSGTVGGLARRAGYSEREMYRLLAGVYARLGASNRTEALLTADRWGLLEREDG
jgi:DNA-binding NarL/FixJ family response regulator